MEWNISLKENNDHFWTFFHLFSWLLSSFSYVTMQKNLNGPKIQHDLYIFLCHSPKRLMLLLEILSMPYPVRYVCFQDCIICMERLSCPSGYEVQLSALSLFSPTPWATHQNVVTLSTCSACWPCTTMEPRCAIPYQHFYLTWIES